MIMNWNNLCDTELRYIKLFLPMVVEMLSVMATSSLTLFYSAKIGGEYIVTGVGIATLLNIGILYSFGVGYGTVFDAFVGSVKAAYGDGAIGGLVVKCALQGTIIYLLSLAPYFCFGFLVSMFGHDENVHRVALLYMKLECARPLLLYMRDLLVKYLVVQGFPLTSLIVSVFAVALHMLLGWFCVVYMQWGLYGLAAAQIGNSALLVLVLVLICLWRRRELEWEVPYDSVFSGWGEMLKLGCFTGLRITSTYGLLISSHILSQSSGASTAEAVVVIDKISLPFFSSIFGGGYAIAMLTGEALGNEDRDRFKFIVKVGLANWVAERSFTVLVYQYSVIPLSKLITTDEAVLKEIGAANPAMGAMLVVVALDELLARGVLAPTAKQAFVGLTTMACIYLVGIPLMACLILIHRVRASIIFWCFVLPYALQCLAYVVRISYIDIEKEIEYCRDRNSALQQISDTGSPPLIQDKTVNENTEDSTVPDYNTMQKTK